MIIIEQLSDSRIQIWRDGYVISVVDEETNSFCYTEVIPQALDSPWQQGLEGLS